MGVGKMVEQDRYMHDCTCGATLHHAIREMRTCAPLVYNEPKRILLSCVTRTYFLNVKQNKRLLRKMPRALGVKL